MAKCELIWLVNSQALNPGHLASRGGCVRDAGQRGSNPGRPGQSGTGGNPNPMAYEAGTLVRKLVADWLSNKTKFACLKDVRLAA